MQTLGIIDMVWKGIKLPNETGATFKPSGLKNNTVNAGRQSFRSQEFQNGEVKATMPYRRGDSLSVYSTGDEGELQVRCDTGQVFIIASAWITETPTITGGQGGKAAVTWQFGSYQELVSG